MALVGNWNYPTSIRFGAPWGSCAAWFSRIRGFDLRTGAQWQVGLDGWAIPLKTG